MPIYFIREESEVFEKLKMFCIEVENLFGENVKEIHSNGGKEYVNKNVKSFLDSKGTKFTANVSYTPQQNGIVERDIRIILKASRSMIYSKLN